MPLQRRLDWLNRPLDSAVVLCCVALVLSLLWTGITFHQLHTFETALSALHAGETVAEELVVPFRSGVGVALMKFTGSSVKLIRLDSDRIEMHWTDSNKNPFSPTAFRGPLVLGAIGVVLSIATLLTSNRKGRLLHAVHLALGLPMILFGLFFGLFLSVAFIG